MTLHKFAVKGFIYNRYVSTNSPGGKNPQCKTEALITVFVAVSLYIQEQEADTYRQVVNYLPFS